MTQPLDYLLESAARGLEANFGDFAEGPIERSRRSGSATCCSATRPPEKATRRWRWDPERFASAARTSAARLI